MAQGFFKCPGIMLGTAGFGLNYGVANRRGRVSGEEACSMVRRAIERGASAFDTAPGYGESEKVLGDIFRGLGAERGGLFLSDKIPPVPEGISREAVFDFIRSSVQLSLKNLGLDFLDVCLFHREKDAVYLEELLELKHSGMIGEAGVSVYTPSAALGIAEGGLAGALQAPASALDRRFLEAGVFESARERGMFISARSVYLQGLMLMDEDDIPPALSAARPALGALEKLSRDAGMERSEFALRYVLSLRGVSSVIVGADCLKQLEGSLDAAEKGPLDPDVFAEANEAIPELKEKILLPFNWG